MHILMKQILGQYDVIQSTVDMPLVSCIALWQAACNHLSHAGLNTLSQYYPSIIDGQHYRRTTSLTEAQILMDSCCLLDLDSIDYL